MSRRAKRLARRTRMVWLSRPLWSRRLVFLGGAVAVGSICVVFAEAAGWANQLFRDAVDRYWWAPLAITPIGFALLRWLTTRYFTGAQGSGIPQTMAALRVGEAARASLLSVRIALGKILLTLLGLCVGASVGREGPSVQVGASLMHAMSRLTPFPFEGMRRGLILAGGAAGISAAFNAPLAGVVFAIEEMSGSFANRTAGIVVTAVVVSGIVAMALAGNYAYFGQVSATIDLPHGLVAVGVCGAIGGLAGGVFSRIILYYGNRLPGRLEAMRRHYPLWFAATCGLIVAIVGIATDGMTFGTGYGATGSILAGATPHFFGIAKFLATLVTYLSGVPGGIFAPSLAVGAGLGANLVAFLPGTPAAAVVILCVVGYFSGVVQAPLTAFVIVSEMTRDAAMTLPLMACALIGTALSRLVCPTPLYHGLAKEFLGRSGHT